jgi:hypothetical protein
MEYHVVEGEKMVIKARRMRMVRVIGDTMGINGIYCGYG